MLKDKIAKLRSDESYLRSQPGDTVNPILAVKSCLPTCLVFKTEVHIKS